MRYGLPHAASHRLRVLCAVLLAITVAFALLSRSRAALARSARSGAATPILIGVPYAKTGAFASFEPTIDYYGVKMAIKALGHFTVAGKKYYFKPVFTDDQSDNTGVITAINTEVAAGAKIIVGADSADYVAPGAGPLTVKKHVMWVSNQPDPHFGGDPATQLAWVKGAGKLEFATSDATAEALITPQAVKLLPKSLFPNGVKSAYILLQSGSAYDAFVPALQQGFKKLGINVEAGSYDPTATDFTAVVAKAAAFHPDVLLYGYLTGPGTQILRAAENINAAKAYFGYGTLVSDATGGAIGHPISQPYVNFQFIGEPNTPGLSPRVKALFAEFKKMCSACNAATVSPLWQIDTFPIIAKAMQMAKSVTNVDRIAANMTKATLNGIRGPKTSFGPSHNESSAQQDCMLYNGKTTCLETYTY